MPSKYWDNYADLSRDSSAESSQGSQVLSENLEEVRLPQVESTSDVIETGNGNETQSSNWDDDGYGEQDSKSTPCGDQKSPLSVEEDDKKRKDQNSNITTLSRVMAANFQLPTLQPHEHASLFYLSLIEGRCRTQAVALINAGRPLEDHVAENHPDVDDLASHLFAEMSKELLKAGMIPEEFVGRPLPELRLYLSSFDSMLNNIVATTPQDLPEFESYRKLDSHYNHPRASRGSIATITSSEDSLEVVTGNRSSQLLRSGSAVDTQTSQTLRTEASFEPRTSQLLQTGSAFETRPQLPYTGSAFEARPQLKRKASGVDTRPLQPHRSGPALEHQPSRLPGSGSAFEIRPSLSDDISRYAPAENSSLYNSASRPSFVTPFNSSRALIRGSVSPSPVDQPSYESATSANYIGLENSHSSSTEDIDFNSRALVLRNQSLKMSNYRIPESQTSFARIISLLITGKSFSEIRDPLSDFQTCYTIKKVLGAGGFGRVYQVVYNLDKAEYAVKRIVITAEKIDKLTKAGKLSTILKEVEAMAKLNHPHIVQYHHSWLESRPAGSGSENSDDSGSGSDSENEDEDDGELEISRVNSRFRSISMSNERALNRDLLKQISHRRAPSSIVAFEASPAPSPSSKKPKSKFFFSPGEENDTDDDPLPPSQSDLIIYIKMKSYPLSLADYLEKEHHCYHPLPTILLLRKLLAGVTYLHRKKIIHADLKPANIFLAFPEDEELSLPSGAFVDTTCQHCDSEVSSEAVARPKFLCPHIGDFGLVADLMEAGVMGEEGSTFYRPKIKEKVCPKLDVYALGVVSLELSVKFGTATERAMVLDGVREGRLPAGFDEGGCAVLEEGVRGMLCGRRDERWDCEMVERWLDDVEGELRGKRGKGKNIVR